MTEPPTKPAVQVQPGDLIVLDVPCMVRVTSSHYLSPDLHAIAWDSPTPLEAGGTDDFPPGAALAVMGTEGDGDDPDQLAEAQAVRAATDQTPEHVAELVDRAARVPLGMGPRVTPTNVSAGDLNAGDVVQDFDGRRRTVKVATTFDGGTWVAFEDGGDWTDRPPTEVVTRLIAADQLAGDVRAALGLPDDPYESVAALDFSEREK